MNNGYPPGPPFTAGAQRALGFAACSDRRDSEELDAPAVLLGLLAESECRAAAMLSRRGIDAAAVCRRWPQLANPASRTPSAAASETSCSPAWRFTPDVEASLHLATLWLAERCLPVELATEHVLLGLVLGEHATSAWLQSQGLTPEAMEQELHRLYGDRAAPPCAPNDESPEEAAAGLEPVPVAFQPVASGSESAGASQAADQMGVLRVIDAEANRAREGLRVVEDYVRFVLDDRHLTERLKRLRHGLSEALAHVPMEHRLAARDTLRDIGTDVSTCSEQRRNGCEDVVAANFSRVQESLRSLEEYGKLFPAGTTLDLATRIEQIRYEVYTLHRAVQITRASLARLAGARLYVLVEGQESAEDFDMLVRDLVLAGVDVLQLRDKRLADRELLERARLLRQLTQGSRTLFVMNDRPDLAALAQADGVHVGQEDLSMKDVRAVVGPQTLIGVSVHNIEQARSAVLEGADYLGVGPTFPSKTKSFETYPGLELLRQVAAEIRLPAFAVGGVDGGNVSDVLATGFRRVAVGHGATGAENPAAAVARLLELLGPRS